MIYELIRNSNVVVVVCGMIYRRSVHRSANVNQTLSSVMPDAIGRCVHAVLFYACAVNAHFNLYMNETETWRLLGKSLRNFIQIDSCVQ